MEARLLIAFLLMGAVLFVTPYFTGSQPQPQQQPNAAQKQAQNKASQPNPANVTPQKAEQQTQAPPPATPAPAGAEPVKETTLKEPVFKSSLYEVKFSNKGGVVTSWILKNYDDTSDPANLQKPRDQRKKLDVVNQQARAKGVPSPFSLDFKDRKPDADLNQMLWAVTEKPDGVDFDYSDGKVTAHKSFRFGKDSAGSKDSYLSRIESSVSIAGVPTPHLLIWRGGFGDATLQNANAVQRTLYYDTADAKLNFKVPKDAKNGPVSTSGAYSFAGLEDNYFTAVALPQGNGSIELRTYSDAVPLAADKSKEEQFVGAGIGGDSNNRFELFVGPKDTDILKKVNPRLEQAIDWGRWFGWLAKPLFIALNWTNDNLAHNYGWAIILVTIGLNMLLLPVRLSGMKSAKKMQSLQPEINAINAKYKNLPMRDPKQAEKNQEVMALYQKHGVNPIASGCAPMLLQFPFFIAFYTVLTVTIEMRGANWLWVTDLSRPEHLAIRILPVILIVTQFLSQKMQPPQPGVDPAQQKAMMIMPLALGFMFYYQSAGLVLYWLTGNLVGIVQQSLMNRASKVPPPAVVDVKPVKKR